MATYDESLQRYVNTLFAEEDEILQFVRKEIPRRGLPEITIKPEEGRFLQLLARSSGAVNALEIGTLGGYSAIWIARGLGSGGRLTTIEKEPQHADVARDHFERAGLTEQVNLVVGDARQMLPELAGEAPFDFVFIDADKGGYVGYFEWALEHVRVGGIITAHNAFWQGRVVEEGDNPHPDSPHNLNVRVAAEPRVHGTIYPAGDGTLVAVKIA